jgi:hypothetical protein
MAKAKTPSDEKFEKTEFDLFEALAAIDRKDYEYYDRLSEEQKRKFNPYMLLIWLSSVKGRDQLVSLTRANVMANNNMFAERMQDNPKLQWLSLCAASLGKGKQFREYLPTLSKSVVDYKKIATLDEVKKYFSKLHPNVDQELINEISKLFVEQQKRKCYLAEKFPTMKIADINVLNELLTDEEIKKYERDSGN